MGEVRLADLLRDHARVRADETALVLPDDKWGEAVTAVVVAEGDLDEDALVAHVRERLARYKVPRRIHQFDELPKTPTGKVLKRELRDELSG